MSGIGHLGELLVIDKLRKDLRHTVYFPLKDEGIDFVSEKNNNFFKIQVKSSIFQKNSYFWFDLHEKKLVYSKNIFYVFVCVGLARRFMGQNNNFLIVPSLKLKEWVRSEKLARKKNESGIFNIFVYPDLDNKKWVYKNKGKMIDLTDFWNKFDYFS